MTAGESGGPVAARDGRPKAEGPEPEEGAAPGLSPISATSCVGKCFASSSAMCQARAPGPAMRRPTMSGVATTTDFTEADITRGQAFHEELLLSSGDR